MMLVSVRISWTRPHSLWIDSSSIRTLPRASTPRPVSMFLYYKKELEAKKAKVLEDAERQAVLLNVQEIKRA